MGGRGGAETHITIHLLSYVHLRIWQVSACKIEPQSGIIMQVMTTQPPTQVQAHLSTEWGLNRVSQLLSEGCLAAV